ncbi:MAG: ATP synthase F1 subunit delta [Candidatus Omnitrophica bacterium]|nr:ATP synthase F1 subunit delta [Candidatus Omnitrophota bacterium]
MASDPIASRYAQALFEAAKAEGQLDDTLAQATLLVRLLHEEPDLCQFLLNPDVEPADKVGVLDRALKGSWSGLVSAFVHMVVSLGRAEFLQEIVEALQALVDEEHGRLRVIVRSARPLPEAVLGRLRTALERRERKAIELRPEIAPELLGGLQVRLDHRVIDGSIQRQLDELRERLTTVRVH